ncbi:MAG: dimethylamine corrinoid protein 3 [Firmicutes bacterium HGW-Firmicutes-14]|jgi:trimethylamine corrinoid protein|nr:MAG: dimethylamine corrinoid protein 3 [Methanomicrobiales archaeon HGW-Methanomicrobiales-5]PKM81141.1 MAG: dimethylamine corrinoid protein 3 [Firmicutes bacterium HGW-Firmicutes-14]
MSREELIEQAAQSIVEANKDLAVEIANKAIAEGIDPVDMINNGYSEGMARCGDRFDRGEMFLPELIVASDAMVAAISVLEEAMPAENRAEKLGTVVLGTIEGDVHDIGKGIVATMLRVYGFEVHDLGRDVPISSFVAKAKEVNADIVGSSALMTTTQVGQKALEEALKNACLRDKVKTMVGGAVVTQRWADKIGSDLYAENASEAVIKLKELFS